jgi:shikimate 5-dehydrogenase
MQKNISAYHITRQDVPTIYFIGVTTGQSTMTRLFPYWASILGFDNAQLIGVDLPLQAPPELYREAVTQIKYDPLSMGALITTHKINLFNAAVDMFEECDSFALLCREADCISKHDGHLIAHSLDPPGSRRALKTILGPRYWGRSDGHVLCLGAGGAGTAIIVNLLTQAHSEDRPQRILVVNDQQSGLDRLRSIVEQIESVVEIRYILNTDPHRNDELLATLPVGSLVINATGMGKDRPGSPITDEGLFPLHGVAWELNYRGELAFLHQARAQVQQRYVQVYDGWDFFVSSWADHIATIFHLSLTSEQLDQLRAKAEEVRA